MRLGVPEGATLKDIEHLIRSEGWSIRWDEETHDGVQVWHTCNVVKDGSEQSPEANPKREIAALNALRYVRALSNVS